MTNLTDEQLAGRLGTKRPECEWRSEDGSSHRPQIGDVAACSQREAQ
jgi:hypothetical protein